MKYTLMDRLRQYVIFWQDVYLPSLGMQVLSSLFALELVKNTPSTHEGKGRLCRVIHEVGSRCRVVQWTLLVHPQECPESKLEGCSGHKRDIANVGRQENSRMVLYAKNISILLSVNGPCFITLCSFFIISATLPTKRKRESWGLSQKAIHDKPLWISAH